MYKNIAKCCFITVISFTGSLTSSLSTAQTPGSTLPQAQQYKVDSFLRDVKFNDAKSVKKALASGMSPNAMDDKGNSALTIAITEKSLDVAKLLIDTPSIDLERPNLAGETPVMLAAFTGSEELVRYLVEKRQVEINKPGWSALHYAATNGHLKIAAYLLDKNAYVDPESPNRTTALMMAARGGHIEVVKLLLDRDADLSKINNVKMTAIDFAEQHNQTEIAAGLKSRWLKLYKKPYKSQIK
jgi:ankyrin repeat protein